MARFYRWILVSICLFFSFVVHSEPPTISAIGPQSTPENTPTSPILFTIGDAETQPSALTLSSTSSNTTLVSDGDIVFSGTDADRSVVITPMPGESGTTTITITVSDGTDNTSVNFVLTVDANIPPTITSIADQSTNENTPTSPIAFTIGDAETQPSGLTLSATSSNTTLAPDGNIVFGGSGSGRNVVITPATGEFGTTTITITVGDGTDNTSVNFVLTVNDNIPPTITSIADQSTNENTPTSPIAFTIGDAETQPSGLTLSATSSNTTLVPDANIVLGGSGSGRNMVITPSANESGTSTITITVSDGTDNTSVNFVLTVNAPPTISAIGDQSTNENTPTSPIGFTIGDAETQPSGLTVSGTSSNTTLVPDANIIFGGGSGANRTVVITPATTGSGTSTITVTVSDGALTTSTNFVLTVNPNTPPTITAIGPQSTNQDTPTSPIAFTVGDAQTSPNALTLSATSSDPILVPVANIVFGGSGAGRDAVITPAAGGSGTSTITITVSDGTLTTSTNFVLTVNPNTPPTITAIGPQSTNQDTPTSPIAFTVGDAQTSPNALTLSASSSDPILVPVANIVFGGSGAGRNAVITPAAGGSGTSTITITVSDGTLTTPTNFVLTVNPNTPPTITAIGPQSTNQDTPTSPIAFTVGDAQTSPNALTLSATSSDATLVPVANIVFGGSGAGRDAVITPAAGGSGTSTITITVSDGALTASTNFVLTVNAANTPPTISAIGPQSTNQDTPTAPIAFTVGDTETSPNALTLSAASSNAALVPVASIVFGGSGAGRNAVITPAAGGSGTSTITVTVSDGALTTSTNFVLTVNPNTPPTITAIGPQSTNEDTPTGPIGFTVGDAQTSPNALTLSATSSNATLVPVANIVFGGSGAGRNAVITPAAGGSGTSTITITVSDGALMASTNFVLTVNAANTPPTITAIGPQSTNQDTPTAPIAFTVGDAETPPNALTLSAASSNAALVPVASIVFGGSGASRNVMATPASGGSGTSTITVTVSDGALTTSTNFVLTVNPNTPPTITAIGPQSTNEDTPTTPIGFTVGDAQTSPNALTLSATSSNATLVPVANIVFGGSGAGRNAVITPAAGGSGTSTITITVSDGALTASTNFVLTVNAAKTPPTISAIGPQSTNQDTPTAPIAFTVGDAETSPNALTLSATSSNATLVPVASIVFGGSGAGRNAVITPAAGGSGTSTITVTVSDGALTTSTNFVLTVNPNTPPTITAIGPQSTNQDTPTSPIAFTVGDAQTSPNALTLSATSSDATLVPVANIVFGGSGAGRDAVITPTAGGSGTSTITITVSDGALTASTNFVLTVNAANTPPTISAIGPQSTNQDIPTAPIAFTVGDTETSPNALTLSAASSNAALVPFANIVFGGSGAGRNAVITPAAGGSGTSTITVTVSDGALTTSTNFVLTVNPNTPPTITAIGPQSTNEDTPTGPIGFTVGDAQTSPNALTLSATSSDATLVPVANIVFGGSGAGRNAVITPAAGGSGTSTITITVSDGALTASTNFVLTVNAANTPPTISAIGPQSTNENTPTGPIVFTIADAETQPSGLTLSGSSSNITLVPNVNITFGGGNGSNRNVILTPAPGQSGTSTITITVSDGTLSASTNFVLTVNPNTPPTITAIGPQSTNENTPTSAIGFTIGDAETQPRGLTLSGTSSNTVLVPNANVSFGGGNGPNRNIVLTPSFGQSGTTTITVTVSDGTLDTSVNFVLTVNAVNDPPTISAVGPQSTLENTPTAAIAFTIGDPETAPSALTLSGTSSNTTLVANANIVFGGNDATRNVIITPNAGRSGTTTTTLTVSDGVLYASTNFILTVTPDAPPTITAIGPQTTNQDTPTSPIAFTVGDAESLPNTLTVSATSSNVALVPNANIVFSGTDADRTLVITPAVGASGTTTITVTVDDGNENTTINFVLTVNAANTPPTITAIGPQSTNESIATSPIAFTIGDAETPLGTLSLAGSSSNTALIPDANIVFGGSGANRTVVITPATTGSGTSTITITVGDGALTASTNFVMTVNPNTPPTITAIGPQSTNQDTPTSAIAFTIGDAETSPNALTLSATSSDAALIPVANIAFGGSGAGRNAVITPAAGLSGTSTITITVSDGTLTASTNFVLTVNAANTPPTITAIGPQSTNENTPTSAIAFTIGDAETPLGSLALAGSSSNTTLVPDANITFGGSGANRTVVITPATTGSGTSTITITVGDGSLMATTNFVLTVNPNTPPTITAIGPQATNQDTPTGAIAFTVGDAETSPNALTLSATSSNAPLIPVANIVFGGSGAGRSAVITPAAGLNGTSTITITVSDGTLTASTNFVLTVNAANTPPTITAIGPQSTNEGTPTPPIAFTIGDAETPLGSLALAGSSSNTTLVPDANITFGGSGANRTVVITPATTGSGTSTITITVGDGSLMATTNFVLTVNPNTPPTITAIGPQSTNEDTPTGAIAFTVGDAETSPNALTLSATSSNAVLIPVANIAFGGSGAGRNVIITPAAGLSGTSTITITVSDGTLTVSTNFVLTVNPGNTAPTITAIAPQSTAENTPTSPIVFTIVDAETQPSGLTLSGTSSNTALIPNANISFGGNGSNRTVVLTPAPTLSGTSTITITVSDGTLTASTNFVLTVNANTPPTITAIGPQSTNESTPTSAITFTIGDTETQPVGLTVTGTSSNTTLVPNANIAFGGGNGASRTVVLTPSFGLSGTTDITVTVSDGALDASVTFVLTVNAVNDPPTISAIGPQSTLENIPTAAIAFTIGDPETPAGSLMLSGTSSDATLVADANIVFGGTAANRNVIITPNTGQTGTTTATLTVSDGVLYASTNFVLTVVPDAPPTITAIGAQSTNQDTPTSPIAFTIGDPESLPSALTVSATSSNPALVPDANIVFGGTDADRTLVITPAAGASGTTTITIIVDDGTENVSINFVLTVNAANTPPTISAIGPQSTNENTPTSAIAFTVGDAETPPGSLAVAGSSSNPALVPDANIAFGGSGANRTVVITPATTGSGTSTITITVGDGALMATTNFVLTVNPNTPPTITAIGPQSTNEDTPTGPIAFTVGDAETSPNALTLSATSSDATLIPVANIVFGGSGAGRNAVITPATGLSGTSTITIIVSDGTLTASSNFVLTVNPGNTPPTITAIGPQSTAEGTPTAPIAFTIGDAETPPGSLALAGSSSNTALVPNANIAFGGSGANRTVVITPATTGSGTSTITITVGDGSLMATTNFVLTVNPNTPPTITAIGPQSTNEDTPTGAIAFTVGDIETSPNALTLSATSSNAPLIPVANIVFGGSGASRTAVITPAAGLSGTSTITITVSDGTLTTPTNFVLTVNAVNSPPTISNINDQTTPENTPTGTIAFTVADLDNPVATLTVTGTSSNAPLVPDANIVFGGSGANRTVIITPVAGQSGTATITITVSDGTATGTTTFQLNVNDVNNPPTISAITDQTTTENTPTAAIPFTVGDAETPAGSLTLTATSSNTSLIPVANISFGGSGANRTVTINPGASLSGSATVTITVSDGTSTVSTTFNVNITPVNDAPTVTPIANQTTTENTPTGAISFNIGDAETPAANLIVTGTSSVTTLVPNGNIVFGGSGSDRTVTLTPAPGESGSTTITINVGDGTVVTSITFTLAVGAVNDAPTITAITNQTTTEDVATPALPFTIGDAETAATSLTVTASSSDNTLVPDANVVVSGSDISRSVTVTPASNQTGTTTITLTVSDGAQSTSTTFVVTVTGANDPPTIASISDQTTAESTATPTISFKVNDLDNAPASLTVTATSSNLPLVPVANINLGGSGEDRTVMITPVAGVSGTTTITITVSDGAASASTSFQLTVTSVNDAPTITAIPAQTAAEDVPTASISFTIGDAETPAIALTVTASSNNKTLVPDANIILLGTSNNRTVRITPAPDKNGVATITLTVSDGTASAQVTFTLTVTPVNDAPTITGQDPLATLEDTPITLVPGNFDISDPDNVPTDYSLLILNPCVYCTFLGNTITPSKDFDGDMFVTVKVSDGKLFSREYVAKITVTDVNIPPVITGPEALSITVNDKLELDRRNIFVTDVDSKAEDISILVSEGDNYTISGPNLNTVSPFGNYTGDLTVVIRANDGKATGEPFTLTIHVVLPSSIPLITAQSLLVIEEDTQLVLDYADLIVSDLDDTDYPAGFTMSILPGQDYSVDNLEITPSLNYFGFLDVAVTVNDGENTSKVFPLRIYVTPINDAPEVTILESNPISYEPGTGPVSITEEFEAVDVDNDFLQLAEIGLIDSNYSAGNDELIFENVDTSPIRGIYDASKGVLSLLGYATTEAYIAAIRSIKYNYQLTLDNNGNQTPISTAPKRVYFRVSDGQLASDTSQRSAQRSIELRTSVELSIPNTFTPNGDSENNTWAVQPVTSSDQFDDTIVRVYTKRGLLVYESVGLAKEKAWDGTFKGELLPVDTYYYTIDLKLPFTKKTYKGAVMILR